VEVDFVTPLLRDPDTILRHSRSPRQQASLARTSLLLIALGGAAFGAAVGSYRGDMQLCWAALKLVAATLATLAVCGPAFVVLAAAFGRRWSLRTTLALMLAAGARSSLVLLAFTPVVWLAIDLGTPYGIIKALATISYGIAGLSALALMTRGLGDGPGKRGAIASFVLVFLVVGAQSAWLLRPFLGDPRDEVVPFLAHGRLEGGVIGSLWRTRAR
jgi:hypothetical protein